MATLPMIVPHDAYTLWLHPSNSSAPYASNDGASSSANAQQQQQRRSQNSSVTNSQSLLSVLSADEEALNHRKLNIKKFGATWIRPPGVSKTLQGMIDEQAERQEQEAIQLREQAREEQERMAQEASGAPHNPHIIEGAMDVDGTGEDVDGMDRDLDDEVAEAEDEYFDASEDGADGIPEQLDLDADIPEAGSYQHTDTEVEDESTDDEANVGHGATVVQDFRQSIGPINPGSSGSARFGPSSTMSSPTMPSRGPRRNQR